MKIKRKTFQEHEYVNGVFFFLMYKLLIYEKIFNECCALCFEGLSPTS